MIPIRDTLPRRNKPIATYLLILVNALVFLFELTMPPDELEQIITMFGLVPARFMHPDWASSAGYPGHSYWPFLTSMFLHGGWLHIIGNLWTLWIFGDNIEDQMGPARYVIFYLLCGLIAGIVHCLTNADSTVPTVGASGAIAGVMGAYLFLFPTARIVVLVRSSFFLSFSRCQHSSISDSGRSARCSAGHWPWPAECKSAAWPSGLTSVVLSQGLSCNSFSSAAVRRTALCRATSMEWRPRGRPIATGGNFNDAGRRDRVLFSVRRASAGDQTALHRGLAPADDRAHRGKEEFAGDSPRAPAGNDEPAWFS